MKAALALACGVLPTLVVLVTYILAERQRLRHFRNLQKILEVLDGNKN